MISGGFKALPSSIQGNIIGLGADGVTAIPNTSFGIQLIGVPGAVIGGLNPNEGNIISANTDSGIALAQNRFSTLVAGNIIGLDATGTLRRGNGGRGISHGSGTNNAIRANRIAYNAGLGIDLLPAGFNTNNVDGNNSRPDPLLNSPTIDSATNTGTNILITGTLDGVPGLIYDLEFFLSDFCDPTGFGEGQTSWAWRPSRRT